MTIKIIAIYQNPNLIPQLAQSLWGDWARAATNSPGSKGDV
jgi:hypothetical protein